MKQFKIEAVLTCPSDWSTIRAAQYVAQQLLSAKEELISLHVNEVPQTDVVKSKAYEQV